MRCGRRCTARSSRFPRSDLMRYHTTLSREVEAAEIPYGGKVMLASGTVVTIAQALGGSFTVLTPQGYMVRIASKDADALGDEFVDYATKNAPPVLSEDRNVQDMAWDMLRTCYDPEIPVNIVDLGLVYECAAADLPEGGKKVNVRFTLTAPGCGMGDYLRDDIRGKLSTI